MAALSVAAICLLVSLVLGAWRAYCRFLERKAPKLAPALWKERPFVQWSSFLVVAVTSVYACFVGSALVGGLATEFIGNFSFGGLLMLRWIISGLIGLRRADLEIEKVKSRLDGEELVRLGQAGFDLSKPHPINFFFSFPSRIGGERIAAMLQTKGFSVQVDGKPKSDNSWALVATKPMVLGADEFVRWRTDLSNTAALESGSYDGWGTQGK